MLEPIPDVPLPLLKELERLFPDACPRLTESDRQIWFNAGRRSVVNLLRKWYEENNPEKGKHNVLLQGT